MSNPTRVKQPRNVIPLSLSVVLNSFAFFLIHIACFAAIFTGVTYTALFLCGSLYIIRMFGVTAGYHRYFSHRSYKMGRVMQFLMAVLTTTSVQRGPIWWANAHRHHHKYSDEEGDWHSPRDGIYWSHVGWIIARETYESRKPDKVKDLQKYPELRWIDKYHAIPPLLLALSCYLIAGAPGLVVGFCWSTVLLWHGTFSINSLSHILGKRRYATTDDSKNNWVLALLTMGEGWHNNHHHYQASTAQGFRWFEFDITYRILRLMQLFRLVSGVRPAPKHVIEEAPNPKALALLEAANPANDPAYAAAATTTASETADTSDSATDTPAVAASSTEATQEPVGVGASISQQIVAKVTGMSTRSSN